MTDAYGHGPSREQLASAVPATEGMPAQLRDALLASLPVPPGVLPDDVPVLEVRGPWFDELELGPFAVAAPAVTLTEGMAAQHRAVLGDRFPLALDAELAGDVVGAGPLADPALVWDVAIGQSTVVTQHVLANLFYRGVRFARFPVLGDTLRTTVDIVALKGNRARAGRPSTGMAVLHVRTSDQRARPVLDFWRCAMLPASPGRAVDDRPTGEPFESIGAFVDPWEPPGYLRSWNLAALVGRVPQFDPATFGAPMRLVVDGGDVVSNAPELARLTLNVAAVHHDRIAGGGQRLVYGGHTIGIAAAQFARAVPCAVAVVGWHSCDHVGPVREGDTLFSTIEVRRIARLGEPGDPVRRGYLADLRSVVTAIGPDEPLPANRGAGRTVLDWRYVALLH